MLGCEAKLHRIHCVVVLLALAMPITLSAQVIPTPGVVQEQIRQQPALPPTTGQPQLDTPSAPAATTGVPAGGKQILIERFEIIGNTVISSEQLRQVVAPYEGRSMTLFEIYEVADTLTQYYRDHGYSVASVTVPAQKVGSGTVKLEVIEGRIGALKVDGNHAYNQAFLESHVTGAAVGDVIAEKALERDLLLLNDLPGLSAKAVVAPGAEFGDSNLTIRTEEKRFDATTRLNNYGRTSIGEWKIEGDFSVNAPLGVGDRFDFNVVHATGGKLDYFNFRYSAPILFSGTRASIYFSRNDYNVDSGELPFALRALDLSGDGDNFGFSIFHPLIRSRKQNLYIGIAYDRVITRQLTRGLGIKTKADISLMNLNLLYSRVH